MPVKKILILLSLGVFLFTFALYYSTLPDINTGYADSDEMITAAKIFGVVHPPGYPLYTMILAVFGRLPIPDLSFAGKVNLASVVLHSLAAIGVFLIIFIVAQKFTQELKFRLLLGLLGTLSLIVTPSFWLYGTVSEVFALNNFIAVSLTLILFLWIKFQGDKKESKWSNRLILLGGLFLGIGLSNQQAILILYPTFVFGVLLFNKKIFLNWKLILSTLVLLIAGFILPYIYLPIAASNQPSINWEDPRSFTGIYRSITRKIFAEASPVGSAYWEPRFNLSYLPLGVQQFSDFMQNEFSFYLIILGIIGALFLVYKKEWKLLLILFLGILGGGLFFANYSAFPLKLEDNYYYPHLGIYQRFMLIAPIFFSIFISLGVLGVIELIKIFISSFSPKSKFDYRLISNWVIIGAFALPIMMLWENYPLLKNNNYNTAHDYGRALLLSMPQNSILLCFTEHSCFSGLYLQEVEGLRRDIAIIQVGFSQVSLDQIKKQHPDLVRTVTPRASLNHAVLLVRDIIRWNIGKRDIYIAGVNNNPDVLSAHGLLGDPFFLVPNGCALKVTRDFTPMEIAPECEQLTSEFASAFYSPKMAISRQFTAYLAYQHYLNAYQFINNGCPKRAVGELADAVKLNYNFQAAKEAYLQLDRASDKNDCADILKGPKIEDLAKNVKDEEAKDSDEGLLHALYGQNQIVSLEPSSIESRLKLADLYMKSRAYNNALYEYSDILELDPKNVEADKKVVELLQMPENPTP